MMGYTIVLSNKPLPVALHQNHAIIVFIEMLILMPNICFKSPYAKNEVGWC